MIFCSYCERKDHKKAQCRKKSRDVKQRKAARPNTAVSQVAIVNESSLGHRQAKDKNRPRRK